MPEFQIYTIIINSVGVISVIFASSRINLPSGHARAALPATFGIAHQISQLSNAMSLDEAASFGVRSTVFITGSRGTGKFSAAMRIARHLQTHIVEVSSHSLLGTSLR